ncbi:preprotein translocase membrane subunit SecY [Erysipelotrichaceae bacterium]|nr:preprotein translocase membrane subunit SecY [Erysipelotrichaceae bacterium]
MEQIKSFFSKGTTKRIVFTIFILFVFRLGSILPVPFINQAVWQSSFSNQGGGLFDFLDFLGGGAFKQFSIFALSVSPYITASIVIQLLSQDVVPTLTRWQKEGVNGKRKRGTLTRVLSLILAFTQGMALAISYNLNSGGTTLTTGGNNFILIAVAIILTAGTAVLMWLADLITKKGIGNGVSMIILAGIVSQLPNQFVTIWNHFNGEAPLANGPLLAVLMYVFLFLLVVVVVYMQEAERRLPIQYTNAMMLTKVKKSVTYLPLKLNSAGVIPVIFANAIITLPITVASIFFASHPNAQWIMTNLKMTAPIGLALYLGLTFLFTFFYSFIQIDPEKVAENLAKQNSFIPSIRPGEETKKYVSKVLGRITTVGAIYLTILVATPVLIEMGLGVQISLGGTSIIILTGVALETVRQLKNQSSVQQYTNFLED